MIASEAVANFAKSLGCLVGLRGEDEHSRGAGDLGVRFCRAGTGFFFERITRSGQGIAPGHLFCGDEPRANESEGKRCGHPARAEKSDAGYCCHAGRCSSLNSPAEVKSRRDFPAGMRNPLRLVFHLSTLQSPSHTKRARDVIVRTRRLHTK